MKYDEQLQLAASWLLATRNSDGGWGLNPKQASSIVNTAEALYVLNKAQRLPEDLAHSVEFLKNGITLHPQARGRFLRYFAFGILGLLSANLMPTDESIRICVDFICKSQIRYKGWGNSFDDTSPRVFPTFLALWTLQMAEQELNPVIRRSLEWLLSIQKNDGGWGFTDDPNENSNASCTAYALIALKKYLGNDSRTQRGKTWLLEHSKEWINAPIVGEAVGGTDWHHCNPAWSLYALLEHSESIFSSPILDCISYFQELFDPQEGGWRESKAHVVNVRSTFWAVIALERAREALDLNELVSCLRGLDKKEHMIETNSPITIMFLSSDPTNASRLRIGEEFREISEQLTLAKQREKFRLNLPQLSLRPQDISRAMLSDVPQIVHFSGHGTQSGALCFENQVGEILLVAPEALGALFSLFAGRIKCVILNACFSEIQAKAISKHVDYVIGMSKSIGDKAAIAFSVGFYQALGAGTTVEEAFKFGCTQIILQGIPEHLTPILIRRNSTS